MSSSSFMSCPRWSDRGTTGWIRKSSASSVSLCWTSNRLQQEGWTNRLLVFTHVEFVQAFWLFLPASVVCTEVLYQNRLGADPVPFLVPCPNPPLFTTTEQQLYINNNMSVPEEHKFIQTKYEMGGRQGRRANEPKWNRAIFSVPKKWQSKCSFVAKK